MGNLGIATSFFNEKNRNIVSDLVELLIETNQELPGFLEEMANDRFGGGGSRRGGNQRGGGGNRYGGSGFGSRDYRYGGGSNRGGGNRGYQGSGGNRGSGSGGGFSKKKKIIKKVKNVNNKILK